MWLDSNPRVIRRTVKHWELNEVLRDTYSVPIWEVSTFQYPKDRWRRSSCESRLRRKRYLKTNWVWSPIIQGRFVMREKENMSKTTENCANCWEVKEENPEKWPLDLTNEKSSFGGGGNKLNSGWYIKKTVQKEKRLVRWYLLFSNHCTVSTRV